MRPVMLSLLLIAGAAAETPPGKIAGLVVDSVSHQPVRKAVVSLQQLDPSPGQTQEQGPRTLTTDAAGGFAFEGLPTGHYQLLVTHTGYPQSNTGGVIKTIQVTPGEAASTVTVSLVPGATISGRTLDEDGDPLNLCYVQPHPANRPRQGVSMNSAPLRLPDGSYRLDGIPAGKYILVAHCFERVFQPRPLSAGPDRPPSLAYPTLFYPAALDLKSAAVLEVLPGTEKSGVDFQFRPLSVTRIHGTFTAGDADWRSQPNLQIQLVPDNPSAIHSIGPGASVNPKDGTFDLTGVFPGAYRLVAFSQSDPENRIGGVLRLDVTDQPLEILVPLHRAREISGTVEIEPGGDKTRQLSPRLISIQLIPNGPYGPGWPPAQVDVDGHFVIKGVLPGEWRIRAFAPSAFLKSVRAGNEDITNTPVDLSTGPPAHLHVLISTNTAAIHATGPAGEPINCVQYDDDGAQQSWSALIGSDGQVTLSALPPGKYHVSSGTSEQDVELTEGQTTTISVQP